MNSPVTAKAAVLQVLSGGDNFGVGIIDRVRDQTQGRLVLNQGAVYPAIRALEEAGLIVACGDQPTTRGGRPRRYYRLTAAGERAAAKQRSILADLFGLQ